MTRPPKSPPDRPSPLSGRHTLSPLRTLVVLVALTLVTSPSLRGQVANPPDRFTPLPGDHLVSRLFAAYEMKNVAALAELYAESFDFHDPTYPLRIREIDRLQSVFEEAFLSTDRLEWSVEWHVQTGQWTVVGGTYESRLDARSIPMVADSDPTSMRFVAAFEIRENRIVRHLDFYEYDAWDRANPATPIPTERRRESATDLEGLADRYVEALNTIPANVDRTARLYADSIRFVDRTFGLQATGIEEMRAGIERFSVPLEALRPHTRVSERWTTGDFIVLRGVYDQKRSPDADERDRRGMEFVTVLRVEAGHVYRQWDFFNKDRFDRERTSTGRQ